MKTKVTELTGIKQQQQQQQRSFEARPLFQDNPRVNRYTFVDIITLSTSIFTVYVFELSTYTSTIYYWLLPPNKNKVQCGPMPNVIAALPNIGGALCSTPPSLADAHY